MNKKNIALSLVASMLLTTSAYAAGTLTTDTGFATIAEESYLQNGMDILDLTSLRYTAEINRPGGSISDPMLAVDITEIEFAYHQTGANTVAPGFDERGRGLTPIQLRTILEQTDAVNDLLEQDYFMNTSVIDVDTNSGLGIFDQINFDVTNRVYAQFDGNSATEAKDGHTYQISAGEIPFKFIRDSGENDGYIAVELYSQTLDDSEIDQAAFNPNTNFVPQFAVNCIRKFDGLINFENDRVSFVNPAHGERVDRTPATTPNDSLVTSDRIVFEIENARSGNTTRWMGGHLSEFRFDASNNNNDFAAAWIPNSTVDIFTTNPDNVDTTIAGDVAGGTIAYAGNTFTITYPNLPIEPGTTKIEANLITDGSEPIRAVKFTNTVADLEGGVTANEVTDGTQAVGSLPWNVAGFVETPLDENTGSAAVIAPQNQTAPMATDAGEWMDHAFIAQIPAATENAYTQTKLFIVNRSCAPVTPTYKLIKDGVVTEVTGSEIAVDTQQKTSVGALLSDAGLADGRYAVEIVIPGVAEDFYVYAQAQGIEDKTVTKDLPVYNTSARD